MTSQAHGLDTDFSSRTVHDSLTEVAATRQASLAERRPPALQTLFLPKRFSKMEGHSPQGLKNVTDLSPMMRCGSPRSPWSRTNASPRSFHSFDDGAATELRPSSPKTPVDELLNPSIAILSGRRCSLPSWGMSRSGSAPDLGGDPPRKRPLFENWAQSGRSSSSSEGGRRQPQSMLSLVGDDKFCNTNRRRSTMLWRQVRSRMPKLQPL